MTPQLVPKETEELLTAYLTMFGPSPMSLVVIGPSLEEVQAAVEAGPRTAITLRVAKSIQLEGVTVRRNQAKVRSTVQFETLKLTHLSSLQVTDDGVCFSFNGVERDYDNLLRSDRGRAYTQHEYTVAFNSKSATPFSYRLGVSRSGVDRSRDVWTI